MEHQRTRILYVEDEPALGRIVRDSLEQRGFEVLLIRDGSTLMQQFQTFRPDLCLLDVMVPGEDGFSLARKIKAMDPQVPVVFLTARTMAEDAVSGAVSLPNGQDPCRLAGLASIPGGSNSGWAKPVVNCLTAKVNCSGRFTNAGMASLSGRYCCSCFGETILFLTAEVSTSILQDFAIF